MNDSEKNAKGEPSKLSKVIVRFYCDLWNQGIADPLLSELVKEYAKTQFNVVFIE